MSAAHRSRKPSRRPWCDLKEDDYRTCRGREQVVLTDREGTEWRVCPAHAASLWLTDPSLRFSAKTPSEAIAAVMRQAFGGGR